MANWKLTLLWIVLIVWRIGSAIILVVQGQEQELKLRTDGIFWWGYAYLWAAIQYPNEMWKKAGVGDGFYCLAWVFLVGLTGLGLRFLVWVLLRILFDIEVRVFWGEVFAVIFATICLYIPNWLRRNAVTTQESV